MAQINNKENRDKILQAFTDMGAGFQDVLTESIKLATDQNYFNEWADALLNQETRHHG